MDGTRGVLRLLEMTLFVAVFVTGGVVAWLAATTEDTPTASASTALPVPGPIGSFPTGSIPPPVGVPPDVLPPGAAPEQEVVIMGARVDVTPPAGCTAHVAFIWEVDQSTIPPGNARAVIELDGPAKAGTYRRSAVGGEIRLEIDLPMGESAVWTGDLKSVGGRPVFPTPLPVTLADPSC
ncbi:MAG: hypothetical protein ACRDJP_14185 [Actinomycetota bacterium]